MKNIGYSSTIYLSILVIIIFLYLNNCKKENFSQLCPDYCHDNKIFYNMDICKPCFSKGGKYEKTKDELDKVNILLLPPHSENCPGICKKTSYRYGICSNCFKKGEIYGDIEENCGNYCHKFSSKTGRCKSCFLKDGRLYVDDTKKKILKENVENGVMKNLLDMVFAPHVLKKEENFLILKNHVMKSVMNSLREMEDVLIVLKKVVDIFIKKILHFQKQVHTKHTFHLKLKMIYHIIVPIIVLLNPIKMVHVKHVLKKMVYMRIQKIYVMIIVIYFLILKDHVNHVFIKENDYMLNQNSIHHHLL